MNTYRMTASENAQRDALIKESARENERCHVAVLAGKFGAAERHAATAKHMLDVARELETGMGVEL